MGSAGSLDRKSKAEDVIRTVLHDNPEDFLEGKVVIVTGANSGIGKQTARALAHGKATVILGIRDEEAGQATVAELITDSKNENIHYINLDLASPDSIHEFAKRFLTKYMPLHILINNAASAPDPKYSETSDGIETQFGVGHVGHFLLTNLLLKKLQQSKPARIVNVTSAAHAKVKWSLDNVPQAQEKYNQFSSYALTKYANVLFSNALNRKYAETGVTSYAAHPGTAHTCLTRNLPIDAVLTSLNPLLKNAEQAAATPVYCAIHPEAEKDAGSYFEHCAVSTEFAEDTTDVKAQDALWDQSEIWAGLRESPDAPASYKLVYFTVGGRGEAIRLIFAAAEQDYDDLRYPLHPDFKHEEMLADKQKFPDRFPFGQLPVLLYNEKHIIGQSHAIERFLGERFDMFGADDLQAAVVDGIGEACQDIFDKYVTSCVFSPASDKEKHRSTKDYYDNYFPKACAPLEKMIAGNASGWLVGDNPTIADLQVYYYCLVIGPPKRVARALRKCPGLVALKDKVEALRGVKKYLNERPATWDVGMFQRTKQESEELDYTFTYFDIGGRGECSRLLFAAAEMDFQDNRFPMSETFEHKAFEDDRKEHPERFPFGQLPTLKVGGEIIAQSHSIERFLATEFDLFGDGDLQTAVIDGVGEACQDIFAKLLGILLGPEDGKDEALNKHYSDYLPNACRPLEGLLEENDSGYLVGDSYTLADIQAYYYVLFCNRPGQLTAALKDCPRLLALKDRVESIPGVSKYLRSRPPTWDVRLWQGEPEKEKEVKKHNYVLNYYNIGGRGEAIRLLFAAAEQSYQERAWPMRPDFNHDEMVADRESNPDAYPYGQLPTLEVDGELLAQSHAIERYLAEEFGYAGKDDIEAAIVDGAGEHVNDMFGQYFGILFSPADTQAEKLATHYSEYLPKKLQYLEDLAKSSGSGWLVGDSLTVADIQFYYYIACCNRPAEIASALENFPALAAHRGKVESVPGISKYLAVRVHSFDVDMFQGTLPEPEKVPEKKYSLYYFNIRARGECSRLVFAAAGQPYEDNRWPIEAGTFKHEEFDADKKEHPENYPFGQLPVLEVDGTRFAQTHAIERYLGESFGFMGSNDVEAALIEAAGEHVEDIFAKFLGIVFSTQGEAQEEAMGDHYKNFFPTKMQYLEDQIQSNGGNGFLVGDKLSLADIQTYQYCLSVGSPDEAVKDMPGIQKLRENVQSNTGIKAWLAVRPQTFF